MIGNKCSIICGAPCALLPKKLLTEYVIAADSGLDAALKAGIIPNLVVGDFDSAKSAVPEGTEIIRVSPVKDDTDTILAANTAIERGFTELRFFRALGGRIDHTIANIQTLYCLKKRGIKAVMFGDNELMYFLNNQTRTIPKFDGFLSVFAYEENVTVSERGVKYPLSQHTLTNSFPLGVSNEITADFAEIEVYSGTAIIIETFSE